MGIDGNDYSVPMEYAHKACMARGFIDRIEIEVNHEPVARHGTEGPAQADADPRRSSTGLHSLVAGVP